jgi:copper resistance protein B
VVALLAGLPGPAARLHAQTPQTPAPQTQKPAAPDHVHEEPRPGEPEGAGATRSRTPPPGGQTLPAFIPVLTDEDRRAAFPDVEGHAVHDRAVHAYVLFDRVELQADADAGLGAIETHGWIGRDRDRLWFQAEGDGHAGGVDEAHASVWYGRQIARWWDVVAGVRQDFTADGRTWGSAGIRGLAPYWFEVEATLSVGASGRTHVRAQVQYELLLTNRLILQPTLEAEAYGRSDVERHIGAGLSRTDLGVRLRYERRRDVAPYAGVVWTRTWGRTADLTRGAGEEAARASLVGGLRFWF